VRLKQHCLDASRFTLTPPAATQDIAKLIEDLQLRPHWPPSGLGIQRMMDYLWGSKGSISNLLAALVCPLRP
jgi:hypothetical protein